MRVPLLIAALLLSPSVSLAADDPWQEAEEAYEEDDGPASATTVFLGRTASASLHWFAGGLVGIASGRTASNVAGEPTSQYIPDGIALTAGPFLAGWGSHWVGGLSDRQGSYWSATVGGALGEGAGWGLAMLAIDEPTQIQRMLVTAVFAGVGAAIGGSIGAPEPVQLEKPAEAGPTTSLSITGLSGGAALSLAGSF